MIDVCCYALLTRLTRVKTCIHYGSCVSTVFILAATAAGNPAQILNIAKKLHREKTPCVDWCNPNEYGFKAFLV